MSTENIVVVIGNGLGMAIDPEVFDLSKAMTKVWWCGLNEKQRAEITKFLKNCSQDGMPDTELELRSLQRVYWYLEKNPNANCDLKEAIEYYFTKIVCSFLDYRFDKKIDPKNLFNPKIILKKGADNFEKQNLNQFFEKLKEFARDEKSKLHIITTNYDLLIYTALFNYGLLEQGNPLFMDIIEAEEIYPNAGFFLSIHGGPLFNSGGTKSKISSLPDEIKKLSENPKEFSKKVFVLSDPNLKFEAIQKLEILKKYFCKFGFLLKQSQKILLIGYGGNDPHINQEIRNLKSRKVIHIVEYDKKYDSDSRKLYWKSKFPDHEINLRLYDSILDFDWNLGS